ncbi:MAG: DUF4911 domain-containing protein [Deltaproteobacteria bacterium]|nr:DUF4911 domain-containing protein [Deltaproteobacteria bacterium]
MITRRISVDRENEAFLKFILEGYDGIAGITKAGGAVNMVEMQIPCGFIGDVDDLMESLKSEVRWCEQS